MISRKIYQESEKEHHLRHLSISLGLAAIGWCCSHLELPFFDVTWSFLVRHVAVILWSLLIALLIGNGFIRSFRSRLFYHLKHSKGKIWNFVSYVTIPVVAYRSCESVQWSDRIGLSITVIILAWPLSLGSPLSRRFQKTIPTLTKEKLARGHYVEKFTDFIVRNLNNSSESFSRIAISATWGTGKTDFINRVIAELERLNSVDSNRNNPMIHSHYICPWQAESQEETHLLIIKAIDQALGRWTPQPGKISSIAVSFLSLIGVKSPSKQLTQILESSDVLYNDSRLEKIDKWLEDTNQRVVIFIDDMERVDVEQIRKLLPALNQLRPLKNCCFVFAIDPERLIKAFSSASEAIGYLNKVFDYRISLPAPERREVIKLAKAEVHSEKHPFLFKSLDDLEPVYPRTPRALKQWLAICKAKEEMFFKSIYSYEERNFPAFFLKELIEYEFPGYEYFTRSSRIDSLTQDEQRQKYSKTMRSDFGFPNTETEESKNEGKVDDRKEVSKYFFDSDSNIEEQNFRFEELRSSLNGLIEKNGSVTRFTYAWACSGYTMISGLTLNMRGPLMLAFRKDPKREFTSIIEEIYGEGIQADFSVTSEQFFAYFFREEVTDLMKGLNSQPSQTPILLSNLEALKCHIQSLSTVPPYLADWHNGFLRNCGMLPNLKEADQDDSLTNAIVDTLAVWAKLLSFREVQGSLIRSKSKGWESFYELHTKLDVALPWKLRIEKTFEEVIAREIATVATSNDFQAKFYQLDQDWNQQHFILTRHQIIPKATFKDALSESLFSEGFISAYLNEIFKPQTTKDKVDHYLKQYQESKSFYSLLTFSAAKIQNFDELIKEHRQSAIEFRECIVSPDLQQWFLESYLGEFYASKFFPEK